MTRSTVGDGCPGRTIWFMLEALRKSPMRINTPYLPRKTRIGVSVLLAGLVAMLAAGRPDQHLPTFTDIASQAGIHFKNGSGSPEKSYIFEAKGGGVALLDYDRDGLLDIYFTNGSTLEDLDKGIVHPNALYHALGGGAYEEVTAKAGVQGRGWAMGCAVGDYDNDGWPDIYVLGLTGNILFRNNHDGTFSDVTEKAGLRDGRWCTSAAFFDYDRDGDLDVFIARYSRLDSARTKKKGESRYCNYRGEPVMCGPRGLDGEDCALYRNNGDGTFTDVAATAGLIGRYKYYGLGVAVADVNNDGWPDVYVANDSCPSQLFLNRGNGTFDEVGLASGAVLSEDGAEQAGMGVDIADYDNDGWMDITKTNFANDYNNLYKNQRNGLFVDTAHSAGLSQPTMPFVSWGTRFIDYDNDGWKDIFVATGHVYPHLIAKPAGGEKYHQRRLLFRNLANGKFADVSKSSGPGLLQERASRGAATGDLDNDGDVDIVAANLDDVPSVLRNDGGNAANWLILELRGIRSNRFGIGARIKSKAGGLEQIAEATTASSIFSANDPRVHFGLGSATEAELEIRWPSGTVQTIKAVPANTIVVIDEDRGLTRPAVGSGRRKLIPEFQALDADFGCPTPGSLPCDDHEALPAVEAELLTALSDHEWSWALQLFVFRRRDR
jgi:enediyne biosynthesis protein E4